MGPHFIILQISRKTQDLLTPSWEINPEKLTTASLGFTRSLLCSSISTATPPVRHNKDCFPQTAGNWEAVTILYQCFMWFLIRRLSFSFYFAVALTQNLVCSDSVRTSPFSPLQSISPGSVPVLLPLLQSGFSHQEETNLFSHLVLLTKKCIYLN